jgi:hypothetical protein
MGDERNTVVTPKILTLKSDLYFQSQSFPHILKAILGFIFIELAVDNHKMRVCMPEYKLEW